MYMQYMHDFVYSYTQILLMHALHAVQFGDNARPVHYACSKYFQVWHCTSLVPSSQTVISCNVYSFALAISY